jgi:2-succinyl-5-enolpyruvyl-6-hydroxy-3-cyclohexene-1-carboxylate synthase
MTQSSTYSKQPIINLAAICAQKGVANFIISPGSRSAPLTVAFARQPELQCRMVMDERAAAFIALGLAQQTGQPVGVVCTSGTAGLNYAPAVTEAFFQRIPLLIFTADRPPEWIDQQDGQTIRQTNLYGSHIRASFQLPVDYSHPDAQWHLERIISEAINTTRWPVPGPVQVNVPLREPLYPPPGAVVQPQPERKIIQLQPVQATLPASTWDNLLAGWQRAERKLVVAGLHPYNSQLTAALSAIQQNQEVAVIGDLTANIHQAGARLHLWDMVLGTKSSSIWEALAPDLLVTFGGQVVSKYLKLFLRKYKPRQHWHIDPAGQAIDTFQSLTRIIPTEASYFFAHLSRRAQFQTTASAAETYLDVWLKQEAKAQKQLAAFLAEAPFGEFQAVHQVIQALPEPSRLQLGNSMPVRYANFIGLAGRDIQVNANRGTSGIDGTVSTTVGAALATDQIITLITGDLAFFYDRNALWHNNVPKNLRLVILNNHGGGIFKLIDGPNNLPDPELTTYFETPHSLNAKNTAADHNCAYYHCTNVDELQQHLQAFFTPGTTAAILEIETDRAINTEVFQKFKAMLA